MHPLRAEAYKAWAYRTPVLVAGGGWLLVAAWAASLVVRGQAAGEAMRVVDSALAMSSLVLTVVWFLLPMVVVGGDLVDGTLGPALVAVPHPRRVILAKAAVSIGLAVIVALCAWGAMAIALALRPDGAAAIPVLMQAGWRLVVVAVLCSALGAAAFLLSGHRGAAWLTLALLVWSQLGERVLISVSAADIGMRLSPFRLIDFWVRVRWDQVGQHALDDWAPIPLTILVAVSGAAALLVLIFRTDRSGRPWSRKGSS